MATRPTVNGRRQSPCWVGTPEIYFAKAIDNSRLVKLEDPNRGREMRQFGIAMAFLFLLVMTYAWQHFKAIEYGYKIEALRTELNSAAELNHVLQLEDASLRAPERIDKLARKLGLQNPEAGQVIRMETPLVETNSGPVMASIAPISVVSSR
jgi:hypothetical protein